MLLIGKEFSKPTAAVKRYLKERCITFEYIDIDEEKNRQWQLWLKRYKVMGLPVLKSGKFFTVGFDITAIENLIKKTGVSSL